MRNIVYLISLLTMLLSSCSHDIEPDDKINQNNVLVKRVWIGVVAGPPEYNFFRKYTYNDKKLERIDYGPFIPIGVEFTYTGDLITSQEYISANAASSLNHRKYIYEYDANGRLEVVRIKNGINGNIELYKKYTYNLDGTVLENNDPSNQLTYYFNNKNIVKTVRVTPSSTTTLNYTYDSKNSIFKNVIGLNKLLIFYQGESGDSIFLNEFQVGYQNNIKSIISETGEQIYKLSYEYSAISNFPTKSIYDQHLTYKDKIIEYY